MRKNNLANTEKPFFAQISADSATNHGGSANHYGGKNHKINTDTRRKLSVPICKKSVLICGKDTFSTKTNLTKFQLRVLKTVNTIPFGQVRTYKWVAKKIGSPKATRAVGQALKKNPYTFVIPCHRVIKSDGSIGGYVLGINLKKELLMFENGTLE